MNVVTFYLILFILIGLAILSILIRKQARAKKKFFQVIFPPFNFYLKFWKVVFSPWGWMLRKTSKSKKMRFQIGFYFFSAVYLSLFWPITAFFFGSGRVARHGYTFSDIELTLELYFRGFFLLFCILFGMPLIYVFGKRLIDKIKRKRKDKKK